MRKFLCLVLLFPLAVFSQPINQPSSSQIQLKLKKLNFLGSVLYMAAHPDDENTKVITYLSNDKLATTAYLALTRGDGGQNLIGPEIGDLLGLIRTQELLAARRIDGGQQFFTRAVDFGFSKSADEAFEVWGKQNVFSDVIKVFRMYKPDVILTRFPPDERAGHGHHTASAVLAEEAFDASAKADVFPEYAEKFGTWQPKRLFTNMGRWWNPNLNESTPGVVTFDVGGYNAMLGKSYSEISALSSSQHKSQGWGRRGERGYQPEFFEQRKGETASKDIFEGVNTTWSRVSGGEKVQPLVDRAIREFDSQNPALIVPQLFAIRNEIAKLSDGVWKTRKLAETEQLIQDCLGLYIEATSLYFQGTPGEKLKSSIEVVARASGNIKLEKISSKQIPWDTTYSKSLSQNKIETIRTSPVLDSKSDYSDPYWLEGQHSTGIFNVKKKEYIGLPENPPAIDFSFTFSVGSESIVITKPLVYKWVDPVKGELYRPFEIVPPIFINPADKVVIFNDAQPKKLNFVLKSSIEKPYNGILKLELPQGWKSEPASIEFSFTRREEEQTKTFTVYPSTNESSGTITALATIGDKTFNQSIQLVSYDHIPTQTLLPLAEITAVRMALKKNGNVIGYIKGAGDEVPAALRNIGYEVWEMKDEEVTASNLKKVDAVVLGVRAFNVNKRIKYFMPDLLNYVKEGGTMVVQYNVNFDFGKDQYGPYPFKLSRDRVTEENAEVKILKPDHPIINGPNKITDADFSGWVQERGLYFAGQWDPQYEAILSMHDKKEDAKDGSLLVANYGEGHYVYTGLSFFRQLPEGVTGAYKLFANIVSLHKAKKPENTKVKTKTK
jgi:LmbE family N-acetylglucosaminyl deacetylase